MKVNRVHLIAHFLCVTLFHHTPVLAKTFYKFESNDRIRSTVLKDKLRYLIYDRSRGLWAPLARSGNGTEHIWINRGEIKVIIHGFSYKTYEDGNMNLQHQHMTDIGQAYIKKDKSVNVLLVDWAALAVVPLSAYPVSARSTRWAGQDIAEFLIKLKDRGLFSSWDKVHLIGFSLGAHAAGAAGYYVQRFTYGKQVGRITGLDPAGPEFDHPQGKSSDDYNKVLDKSDAKFVDVIHCNMGTPSSWRLAATVYGRLGSVIQAGHVDFYPDGGESQSQCSYTQNLGAEACSHVICLQYYKQSVSTELLACPCSSWKAYQNGRCKCSKNKGGILMGAPCPNTGSGRYYISMKGRVKPPPLDSDYVKLVFDYLIAKLDPGTKLI